MKDKQNLFAKSKNDLEQYSRRDSVSVFGIAEELVKNKTEVFLSMAEIKLGFNLKPNTIDRCHHIVITTVNNECPICISILLLVFSFSFSTHVHMLYMLMMCK